MLCGCLPYRCIWQYMHMSIGMGSYASGVTPIPMATIALETADMFARMHARGQQIVVNIKMEAAMQQPQILAWLPIT